MGEDMVMRRGGVVGVILGRCWCSRWWLTGFQGTDLASDGVGGFNQRCGQGYGDGERRDGWGYFIQMGGRWEDAVLS